MKIKIISIIIVTHINIFSQQLLTPEEAVKIALQNNYSINIAKNQAEIADNNLTAGNAGFLPDLNANASYSKSITDTKQEFFDGRIQERDNAKSTTLATGVSLNWTVFDGFEMFASLDRLKSLKETGELNFRSEVENNVSDVISTYYNIVRLQQVIEVIKANILISEERVKIAEAMLEVGSGSRFDLRQAQVALNEDKSSLLREELNLFQAKTLLNNLLARNINEGFTVIDTIIIKNDLLYEDILESAKVKNSQLKIAEENKRISEIELSLARADIFPIISFNAGYNFTKSEAEAGLLHTNRNSGFNYGVTASLNLFDGLNTRRNVENASINIKSSELAYKEIEQVVESNILNTYRRYINSRQIVALEMENVSSAETNLDVALERLRLGNITPLEFRETQNDLFRVKSRLVAALFEAKDAETELLRLSGQLVRE
jgi:outer membrane protein